jgi:hypothetical protein
MKNTNIYKCYLSEPNDSGLLSIPFPTRVPWILNRHLISCRLLWSEKISLQATHITFESCLFPIKFITLSSTNSVYYRGDNYHYSINSGCGNPYNTSLYFFTTWTTKSPFNTINYLPNKTRVVTHSLIHLLLFS